MWTFSSIKHIPDDGWQASEIDAEKVVYNTETAVYRGRALSAVLENTGKTLDFSISTTSLKPAAVEFAIATKGEIRIRLEITDVRTQKTLELQGFSTSCANDLTCYYFESDITDFSSCSRHLKLTLHCSSPDPETEIKILLNHVNNLPSLKLKQKLSGRYFAIMFSIHALLRAILLVLLFTLFSLPPFMHEIFPQYIPSGSSIVIWLSLVLGLPDRIKFPLSTYFRRAVCWLRTYPLVAALLIPLFVGLLIPVHDIVRCTINRVLYTQHIQAYGQDSDLQQLIEAFTLIPNRKEAILLIENYFHRLATEDTYNLRKAAEQVIDDPGLKGAVDQQAPNTFFLSCSCEDASHNLHPRLWLATVLPLAEPHNSVTRKLQARKYIKDEVDAKSMMFLSILELELHELCVDGELNRCGIVIDENVVVGRLRVGLADHNLQHTHLYQEGLDHLAQYEVSKCNTSEAIKHYRRLLEVRERFLDANTLKMRWDRRPGKLSLFHVFREIGEKWSSGDTGKLARQLLERCGQNGFENTVKRELYDKFPDFHNRSGWYKGTFAERVDGGGNLADTVSEEYLSQCWNY